MFSMSARNKSKYKFVTLKFYKTVGGKRIFNS